MPTLHFKGKTFVQNHHLAVKYHQLVPKKDLSLTDKVSLHDNLIIQGDNLKALKALLPTYSGKVKCIYIDPPYNTGNENWVYNDNVNSPMLKEWLGKVVDKEDMTRHDKWLCMMMPRLKLLRELMSEDGFIFISIDDNEMHRLKLLCDEIFGEERFVATINWRKVYSPRMDSKTISQDIDYLLLYSKSDDAQLLKLQFEQNKKQFNILDEKTGRYYRKRQWRKEGSGSRREDRPNLFYSIETPEGTEVLPIRPDGSDGRWRGNHEYFLELKNDNLIDFIKEGHEWQVYVKQFYNEDATQPPSTFWDEDFAGHNQEAASEIKDVFGKNEFATPKPTTLIRRILNFSTDKNDIILDSFAGSGTTAHAVLELNKEDGGNRKFILVEQEDYANTITAERVRRVIKGVKTAKNENLKKGTGGTFSYFALGNEIEMESILRGKNLPSFKEFSRYLFYTATGEEFNEKAVDERTGFIGESRNFKVYLHYKPDTEWLKKNALTLDEIKSLPKFNREKDKLRLVFAPAKYVDDETLKMFGVEFQQLPYEIYRLQK
ncbi:MAG: site-specific DNA-methyltransferase [Bacteroidia bacterium]